MKHEKLINMIDYETTGNHKKKFKKNINSLKSYPYITLVYHDFLE